MYPSLKVCLCLEIQQNSGVIPDVNWPARNTKSSEATKTKSSIQDNDEKTTTTQYGFFQTITTLIVIALLGSIVYLLISFKPDRRNQPLFRLSGNNENDDF